MALTTVLLKIVFPVETSQKAYPVVLRTVLLAIELELEPDHNLNALVPELL